ncbi:MAG: hypothetical protein VB112_04945 [Oscillospiraceae bacterium]|nr:hypothetical protein [Oscillospiraceae bacterium]
MEEDTVDNSKDMVELIAKYNGDIKKIAEGPGASAEILTENYAIITIAHRNIPRLYEYTQIENLELPKNLYIADAYDFISTCVRSVVILTTKAGGGYDSYTGTSMAAPLGCGTLCLSTTMTYMDRYKWGGDEIWLQA